MFKSAVLTLLLASGARAAPLPVMEVPFSPVAPAMDARWEDPAWNKAALISSLGPAMIPGKTLASAPTEPGTSVRALWDKQYLYIRFQVTDAEVHTPYTDRDANHYMGDAVEVFLDPVGDGRHYYEFQVSARGGLLDQYIAITTEPRTDEYGCLLNAIRTRDFWVNLGWNCEGIRTTTRIMNAVNGEGVSGWVADIALPAKAVLKRLGKESYEPGTLRANFLRYDWPLQPDGQRSLVATNWSPVLHGSPHKSAARMGFLRLMPAP